MLRPLRLWWTAGGADVDLGTVYYDHVPRTGELIGHSRPGVDGAVWRVVTVYYPAMIQEGSPTFRDHENGRHRSPLTVNLFVVPAEGPFREDPDE